MGAKGWGLKGRVCVCGGVLEEGGVVVRLILLYGAFHNPLIVTKIHSE